jgi:hypothetical protein
MGAKRNPIARALRLLRPKIKQSKKLYNRKRIMDDELDKRASTASNTDGAL